MTDAQKISGIKTYKRLFNVAKRYSFILVLGLVCTALVSLVDAGFTYLIKPIINKAFIQHDKIFIYWLPFIMLGGFVLRTVSNFGSTYLVSYVARSVVMRLRQMLFQHFMYLPASEYDHNSSGQLLALILYNVDQVAEASSRALIVFLREMALLIGMLGVMLSLSWQLTVIIAVLAPLMMWLIKLCSKRLRRLSHNAQETVGDVTQIAEEGIELYKVIRLSDSQQAEYDKFEAATKKNRHQELKIVATNVMNTSVIQLLIAVPAILFLIVATTSFLHITAGGFASILTAMFGILRPARQLSQLNSIFQKGIAGAASVFEMLDHKLENDHGTYVPEAPIQGAVTFNNLQFDYTGTDKTVLKEVSYDVAPGQMVALVGHSGAGKTTLVNLLPRFYDVAKGMLFIDGVDINDYTLAALREQISFVSQQPKLFNATVAENIAYGQEVSHDKIMQAAKAAHADEFIEQLPKGLDTVVGENGVLLSGGQRQRLAIAQAIMKNAPIFILDEATSALDTKSERHIQAAIEELMQDRTTFVIAHRLSTVEHADVILVMEQGRIAEHGTHQELLAQNGLYAELYHSQFEAQGK